jgi:hypothetical protein
MKAIGRICLESTHSFGQANEFCRLTIFNYWGPLPFEVAVFLYGWIGWSWPLNIKEEKYPKDSFYPQSTSLLECKHFTEVLGIHIYGTISSISVIWCNLGGVRSGAVGWGTALQFRSWVRFPKMSLEFFIDIIFRPQYGTGVDSASNRNEYQEYFLGGKAGRCTGLTTLPLSYADCLGVWEPQPPGTL